MTLVAGVDSSTQSTKVEIRDLDTGTLVASGRAAHPPTTPPRSEQDPAAWWDAFEQAWAQAGSPEVAAISVAGQQHGMVALGADRAVLRPAKLWNDTETAPDAGWLLKQLEGRGDAWAAACGSVPVAAFTIAKLSWLHRSEPEAWERLAHVVLPHDWMTLQLTGELVTDRGDASGTGYWDPATGAYRYDLLAIVDKDRDWTSVVPRVAAENEAVGQWRGATVAPGTGDNMAAALGVGLRPAQAVVSIGTSGTVYARSTAPTHDGTGAVAGFASADGAFLPLVCTLNATKVLDAVARLLGVDHTGLDALAAELTPGTSPLVLLPYFDGERTPNRPKATGVLDGLRSDVTRAQLARAAVDGVVCGLLDGLDALAAAGVDTGDELIAVGGGARSQAVIGALASLSGRAVRRADGDEHVALGAAVQAAAVHTGRPITEIQAAWSLGGGSVVEPDPQAAPAEARARYHARRDAEG